MIFFTGTEDSDTKVARARGSASADSAQTKSIGEGETGIISSHLSRTVSSTPNCTRHRRHSASAYLALIVAYKIM